MASSSISSSVHREQLKETLRSLEAYDFPDSIKDAFSNGNLDPALIRRYNDARDLYLRRHIQCMFLAHIGTYDGHTIQEVPELPTEEDATKMNEQLSQVYSQVQEAARDLQQKTLELRQKHATFCMRREELENMIQDMDDDAKKKRNSNESMLVVIDKDDDDDVDEDSLAQEEEHLAMLQQKKAQLETKLNRVRQETSRSKLKTARTEAEVAELLQGEEPPSPTALQTEGAETQAKQQKLKEMRDFYDGVRGVMEQLNALQVLSVFKTTDAKSPIENDEANDPSTTTEVIVRVRAVQKHDIEIRLRPDLTNPEEYRVTYSKLLTSAVVRAPVAGGEAGDGQPDGTAFSQDLMVTISPLDDLVSLCAMFPPGEDLRFLVRETMARIRMVEARVEELAILHNNVLTKIGSFQDNNDGFGGEEQEVFCSLNECITVVLRLTADCPSVPGSVYISQMVGVGGWDETAVDNIKATVCSQKFKSPLSLIHAIQTEIGRLQEEEGLSLPKTPLMPLRRKKSEWNRPDAKQELWQGTEAKR